MTHKPTDFAELVEWIFANILWEFGDDFSLSFLFHCFHLSENGQNYY